jgi:hypothetical protein
MEGFGSNRLRLWHVSVPNGMDLGYDSYDSFVVACYTEDEARNTSPGGINSILYYCWSGWINFEDIPKIDCD